MILRENEKDGLIHSEAGSVFIRFLPTLFLKVY